MKIVKVSIEREARLFTNDIRNFTVRPWDYDLGDVIGNGATKEQAIDNFKGSWEFEKGEEIDIEIIIEP